MPFTFPVFPKPTLPPKRYSQGAAYTPDASDMVGVAVDSTGTRRSGGFFNELYNGFTIALINGKLQLLIYGSMQDPTVAAKLGIEPDPKTFDDGTPFPVRTAFAVLYYGAVKPGLQDPENFMPPNVVLVS